MKHKVKQQNGGVWDNTKDAGLISGHGSIITDQFVVIPPGISLRPLAKAGTSFNVNDLQDDLDELETKEMRMFAFDSDVYDEQRGHVYSEGHVIPNMVIHFQLIWEKSSDTKIKDDEVLYAVTGVTTERKIDTSIKKSKLNLLNTTVKRESMKSHEPTIDIDWNARLTLGQVLRKIKEKKKEGNYWLLACREGEIVNAELECGSEMLKKRLKTSQMNIFSSIVDKIDYIDRKKGSIDIRIKQLRDNRNLIDEFIQIYIIYCKTKITADNDYTIDSTLLCEINEIVDKNFIKLQTLNRLKYNPLFQEWWKKFNTYRKTLTTNTTPKQSIKRKRSDQGFAFAF